VKRPAADEQLFKNWSEVYQSNTPYLEFKELYVAHTTGDVDIRAGIQRFAWEGSTNSHRTTVESVGLHAVPQKAARRTEDRRAVDIRDREQGRLER